MMVIFFHLIMLDFGTLREIGESAKRGLAYSLSPLHRHSREGGNPTLNCGTRGKLDSRLRGNDGLK